MKTRMKILLALVGLLAAVLIISALRGDDSELNFAAPAGERDEVDLGAPGPSLGDLTVFSGELLDDDDDPAGRIDGSCVVTSAPGDQEEWRERCGVTLTVGTENGETELQLLAVGRAEADDVIFTRRRRRGSLPRIPRRRDLRLHRPRPHRDRRVARGLGPPSGPVHPAPVLESRLLRARARHPA